ncbi:MAG: hypothetical protein RLY58_451 [Pseudomonadota bacterium]
MQQNIFSREAPGVRSFAFALITSMVFMVVDWQHPEWFDPLRARVHAAFDPIYALANYPVLSGEWLSQQAKSEDQLRRENTAMQAELLQSRVRLQKLAELSAENTRLRGLLNTPLMIDGRMLIAEIIGTDTDPLRHILVINRGQQDHVFVGQVVLDDHGVMGQVLDVFAHSSRVLLLSDKEHSASVRIERTGMRGILSGMGDSGRLSVQYVPNTADIKIGDRLLTSGLGQRFPAGYPIATVTDIKRHGGGEFAEVSAKPLAQLEGGHHVLLLFSVPLAGEQPYATP